MRTLREWIREGPFTLALSSSFFGFYAHGGFTHALHDEGLVPWRLTGASAGALVAASVASGLPPHELRKILFEIRKEDFWDPGLGLGYLRGEKFRARLGIHFAPTFEQVKIPLEICVFDALSVRTVFLNKGPLASAVSASCAVPGMFHPVRIGRRFYLDGGMFNKSGMKADGERTLCVYLESLGRRSVFNGLQAHQRVVRFNKFPRLNFNSLERGKLAYSDIFERTRRALDLPFAGPVLEL